jgi:hypothetical protein
MNQLFQDAKIPLEKVERFSAIRHSMGIVGCARSHIEVLKKAKREGWKSVLILEDDLKSIDIETNYPKLEELVTTQTWDVCMLTGLYMESSPPKVHIAFCTNAYIVKSHYYDTLLDNFETGLRHKMEIPFNFTLIRGVTKERREAYINKRNQYNIDVYWFKLQLRDNWIAMFPPMFEQINTYSDIYNKEVQHEKVDIPSLYDNMVRPVKFLIENDPSY